MHLSVQRFVFLLMFAPALCAQARLTLADAVSQSLASHPQLAVAGARVSAAEALRLQAGLAPNPRLILQSENTRFPGSPPFAFPEDHDTYAFLAQTFETGGKRSGRVALGTENVRRSEIDLQLERQQIASRVSTAYWIAAGAAKATCAKKTTRAARAPFGTVLWMPDMGVNAWPGHWRPGRSR